MFVTVPAPAGVELIGTAMNRAAETIHIVAKAEVVTYLMAELVAQRIIQRNDTAAAGATVHLNPIGIFAAAIVRRQLGHHKGMASLPFTGTAVDAVIGIVDTVGDKLLADALTHGAAMPAPFARVKIGQQGAVGQHHLRQGERCILTDNHPAGRNGLEVFAMGLLVIGKGKAIPWCAEHTDVDGVQQQLAGGADLDVTQFTTEIALTNGEVQSGLDPLGRQLAAPGIRCIGDAVVLQLPLAEPLPIGKLELQGLATGDGHLSLAIEGRRVITGAGADPHHLALQLRAHGQVDIPNPATVGGLDLHQRTPGQPILEESAALVAQFGQISTAADDGSGAALRDETHSPFGNPREVVDSLWQRRWRRQGQGAKQLAAAVTGLHRYGGHPVGLERFHQQQALAQTGQDGLAIPLFGMGRQDLALGKLHAGSQATRQIALRCRLIEYQGRGGGRQGASRQGCHDEGCDSGHICGHCRVLVHIATGNEGHVAMPRHR